MPAQTFVTQFRAHSPVCTLTQEQTFAWLVEAHTRKTNDNVADDQIVVSAAFGLGLTLCGAAMRKVKS
jgi:hypothetical protein